MIDKIQEYLVAAATETLTSRQKYIFIRRYGLDGEARHTLHSIAQKIKVTLERVRQIIDSSLTKIYARGSFQRKAEIEGPSVILIQRLETTFGRTEEEIATSIVNLMTTNPDECDLDSTYVALIGHLILGNKAKAKAMACRSKEIQEALKASQLEERKASAINDKITKVLKHTEWPKNIANSIDSDGVSIEPKRKTNTNESGLHEYFDSDKNGRTIYYDSELEMSFYKTLEHSSLIKRYVEQPFRIEYTLDGQIRNYYPDVLTYLNDGRGVVIEIKPVFHMALWKNVVKYESLRGFCNKHGLGCLMTDGRVTYGELYNTDIPTGYVSDVMIIIDDTKDKRISYREYKPLKDKHNPTRDDFISMVLQHELVWHTEPFRLGKGHHRSCNT
jgi:hypothetical protein